MGARSECGAPLTSNTVTIAVANNIGDVDTNPIWVLQEFTVEDVMA